MKIVTNPSLVLTSLHIHNVLTKGAQHKSMVKSMHKRTMAAPPGQFIALQAINALKETITRYRSGTVNSKSFVGKVLLRIKQKFELINAL